MPDELVDCVVTSPPYWGLRDYGTEPKIWDGKEGCEHEWGDKIKPGNYNWGEFIQAEGNLDKGHQKKANATRSNFCLHCSAWRGSLGLEPTPELYVQHIVQIFREVKRLLKKEGTLWLNLGDSYNGSGGDHK